MDVYAFDRFRDVLLAYVGKEKQRNPRFTFKHLARRDKSISAAMLYKIARGVRTPSDSALDRLSTAMQLTSDERRFVYLLIRRERGAPDAEALDSEIKILRRRHRISRLDADAHVDLNRWFYPTLAAMTTLADFQPDPAWVAKRIVGGLSEETVSAAIDTLVHAGVLSRAEDGTLSRCHESVVLTPASPVAKSGAAMLDRIHGEFLHLAASALDQLPRGERQFVGTALPVKKSRLPELVQTMSEFRHRISAEYGTDVSDEVIYISLQWFPLTKS